MNIDELLHESNVIEGFDDDLFDFQAGVAWTLMLQHNKERLDIGLINKVQKILTLRQTDIRPDQRGYIRKVPVYIGNPYKGYIEPMKPEFLRVALMEWTRLEQAMDPKHAHILYESIHPHIDGNGRTGRILMWWRQLKLGQPFTVITDDEKLAYYEWFKPGYESRKEGE